MGTLQKQAISISIIYFLVGILSIEAQRVHMGPTGLHELMWTRWIHMALWTHMAPLVPMDPTEKMGPKAFVLDGPICAHGPGAWRPGPRPLLKDSRPQ